VLAESARPGESVLVAGVGTWHAAIAATGTPRANSPRFAPGAAKYGLYVPDPNVVIGADNDDVESSDISRMRSRARRTLKVTVGWGTPQCSDGRGFDPWPSGSIMPTCGCRL